MDQRPRTDKAGAQTPQIGKRGAAEIPLYQRILLGVLGAAAAAGGALLMLRPDSPELGGTALMIIAALFLAFMVIGRLPKMLEIAGVPLEFERDEMAEFLRTLRAAVDADTLLELEDQLKNMSSNAKTFKEAQASADKDPEASAPTSLTRTAAVQSEDPDWLALLKHGGGRVTIENDARVPGGTGSGRGQPPVVDHLVRFDGKATVVVERTSAWNESTLRVLERRLNRVRLNLPSIQRLIVILPAAGMEDANRWRKSLESQGASPEIQVLAEESDEAAAVESWLNSLEEPRE